MAHLLEDPETAWIHRGEDPYQLPEPLAGHAERLLTERTGGRVWRNETKISLLAFPDRERPFLLTRTATYHDQLVTHEQPPEVLHDPVAAALWY